MPKMIQVRNVPDELHQTLKVQAAQRGMTLSDYLLEELEEIAGKPTLAELVERIRQREGVEIGDAAVRIIREHRGPLP
ncbi:MAG: FitA-like ribbon-helix-helix domain-containing protein [Solirubrobacterales bacterium]